MDNSVEFDLPDFEDSESHPSTYDQVGGGGGGPEAQPAVVDTDVPETEDVDRDDEDEDRPRVVGGGLGGTNVTINSRRAVMDNETGDDDEEDEAEPVVVQPKVDTARTTPTVVRVGARNRSREDTRLFGEGPRQQEQREYREKLEKAGLLDTGEEIEQDYETVAKLFDLAKTLKGEQELTEGDFEDLNEVFGYMNRRNEVLAKRDRALNMEKVTAKYEDIVSPETGVAFDHLTKEERDEARGIYIKGKRVGTILSTQYDALGVSPDRLNAYRDQAKEAIYKKGVKLGEVKSMDKGKVVAERANLSKVLLGFYRNEHQITRIQHLGADVYVKPENKITKKEMTKLIDICSVGLMRHQAKESHRDLEKRMRELKRADVVNGALDFLQRRIGRFEWARNAIERTRTSVQDRLEAGKAGYHASVDRLTGITTRRDESRKEIRNRVRNYGTEKQTKKQREDQEYADGVQKELGRTLTDIQRRTETSLKKIMNERTMSFLLAGAGLITYSVLTGAGMPPELIGILSGGFSIGVGILERGVAAFQKVIEKRAAYKNAHRNMRDNFGGSMAPSFA